MSELSEFINTISVVLPRIHKKVYAVKSQNLKKYKLTPPLYDVMEQISMNDVCRMSDVADEFKVSMPAVTALVDRLIKLKYVKRESDPDDRRVVRLVLTVQGVEIVKMGKEGRKAGMTQVFKCLSISERENYLRIIKKLSHAFEKLCLCLLFTFGCSFISYAQGNIELSVDDAAYMALENSMTIQAAQHDASIAELGVVKSKSLFDYYLNGAASYEKDRKTNIITGSGVYSNEYAYSVGITKKVKSGTTIGLDVDYSNINGSVYGKYNNAETLFSIKQELGRNFFGLSDRGTVSIAQLGVEYSQQISLDLIEHELAAVQKSYWYLVLQQQQVRVTKKIYNQAVELYQLYEKKYSNGSAEEVDYLAIKSNMIDRQNSVLSAVLQREKAKNILLKHLNIDDMSKNIISTDSLTVNLLSTSVINSMKQAMLNRRDYKRMLNIAKANDIDIKIKKNALWPQMDISATYSANGIANNGNVAVSHISSKSDDKFFVGMTFSLALDRSSESADLKAAKLLAQKIIAQTRAVEVDIVGAVNNSILELSSLKEQAKLTLAILDLQKRKLIEEKKRIEHGRSNADYLVRYQGDVLNAEVVHLKTLYSLKNAEIDKRLVENTLLSEYTVENTGEVK